MAWVRKKPARAAAPVPEHGIARVQLLRKAVGTHAHAGCADRLPSPLPSPSHVQVSHMDHHYVDETVGYGISSTLYDVLFGTMSQHLAKKAV